MKSGTPHLPLRAALRLPGLVLSFALLATSMPAAASEARSLISKQQNPAQRLEARIHRALEEARAGQVQAAIDGLQALLKEHPGHHDVRLLLAAFHADRGELPLAHAALEQGLALSPQHDAMRMSLARLQVQAGDARAALGTLAAGLGARPSAEYRAFYATLLQADGQAQLAIDHYAAALREQPHRAPWWVGLAVSLQALGMNERRAKPSNARATHRISTAAWPR